MSDPLDASTLTRLRDACYAERKQLVEGTPERYPNTLVRRARLLDVEALLDLVDALEAALEKVAALALDHHDGPSRRAALLGIFIAARDATGDNE